MKNVYYLLLGGLFGLTLIRSQVVSWYRIQEMFLFDNFHMYGVIGTAILTSGLSLYLIKRYKFKTIENQNISIGEKKLNKGTVLGGILFGLGWSITGACPGPLYALVGSGALIYLIGIVAALVGVFVYGISLGAQKS